MANPLALSPLIVALLAYPLPCVTSVLIALAIWQISRRQHDDNLLQTAWAFVIVAALQALLLLGWLMRDVVPAPFLRALDCLAAVAMSWAFWPPSARRIFLISSLAACGVLGSFTLSLWQLTGQEFVWAASAWFVIQVVVYAATAVSLWRQRQERSLLLFAAFVLLAIGSLGSAPGAIEGMVVARLIAFPLVLVALVQSTARDLDSVQSELVSFSANSLRQTQQLLTLLRASAVFLVHTDVTTILREAVESVAVGLGADSVLAALVDDTCRDILRLEAIYPPKPLQPATIPLLSQPAFEDALGQLRQVVLSPSQRGIHALAALMGTEAGPAIVQPLICQEQVVGVLVALNGRHQRDFAESDLRVMEAFGAQVAAAAENALLDQMLQAQAAELADLLHTSEEEAGRRAAILESIGDSVIVFDDQEQAIIANPAARSLLNLQETQPARQTMSEILSAMMGADDEQIIRSLIASGKPLPPGFKATWGGRTMSVNYAPVKLRFSGQHGTVMVLHDISHYAEVDKMKSEFMGVISHELRTPFAELDSSIQIIQRYGLEHLLPEQRDQLQQLADGLKRARTRGNNLVTVASFVSKQGQLRIGSVSLGQVAREIAQTFERMARTRGVRIMFQSADPLPVVYGDQERLAEAVYHLIHNAIRFNHPGGTVMISCRTTARDVILEVFDTGAGIPSDKLQEVWKDFAQLADPLRRGVEGLGLGLPLVKYVVRAHGGQVWARSDLGKGSLFGFSIPVAH